MNADDERLADEEFPDQNNASSGVDENLQFGDRIDDGGLSLEALSDSFAEMMTDGEDPYEESPTEEPVSPAGLPLPTPDDELDDEDVDVSPRSILEAMLFVGHPENRPITAREVAALMRGVRPQEIDELVKELNALYAEMETPYHVVSEGPGYRLALKDGYVNVRERFYGKVKAAKLSQAAVDVLAIVAYNQPIQKQQIDDIRNKPSGSLLGQLVRRQLLRIERTDSKPRVTTYHTTDRFLEIFGIDGIQELPNSQES